MCMRGSWVGPVAAKVAAARAGGIIVEAVARVREPSERPWDQNRVGYPDVAGSTLWSVHSE